MTESPTTLLHQLAAEPIDAARQIDAYAEGLVPDAALTIRRRIIESTVVRTGGSPLNSGAVCSLVEILMPIRTSIEVMIRLAAPEMNPVQMARVDAFTTLLRVSREVSERRHMLDHPIVISLSVAARALGADLGIADNIMDRHHAGLGRLAQAGCNPRPWTWQEIEIIVDSLPLNLAMDALADILQISRDEAWFCRGAGNQAATNYLTWELRRLLDGRLVGSTVSPVRDALRSSGKLRVADEITDEDLRTAVRLVVSILDERAARLNRELEANKKVIPNLAFLYGAMSVQRAAIVYQQLAKRNFL